MSKSSSCSVSCSRVSVFVLVLVNLLMGFGGVVIVAYGAYMWSNFSEFQEILSQEVMIYLICSGLILFILSILAIFGAIFRWKKFLVVYVFLLLALVAGEIVVVFVGFDYLGVIKTTGEETSTGTASSDLSSRQKIINDFLLRSYQTCCFFDEEVCSNVQNSTSFCETVTTCAEGLASVCVDAAEVSLVDKSVCSGLDKLNGDFIAPPPTGCGGGNPALFLTNVTDFFVDQISNISIGAGVLVGTEFLLIVFTMYLIFAAKVDYNRNLPWDGTGEVAAVVPEAVSEAQLQRLSRRSQQPVSFGGAPQTVSNAAGSHRNSARLSRNVGNTSGSLRVVTNKNNRVSLTRGGDAVESGATSIVGETISPKQSDYRERAPSVGSSLTKKQMKDDPNVIDSVI